MVLVQFRDPIEEERFTMLNIEREVIKRKMVAGKEFWNSLDSRPDDAKRSS